MKSDSERRDVEYTISKKSMWEIFLPKTSSSKKTFYIKDHKECQEKIKNQFEEVEIIVYRSKNAGWCSTNGNFFSKDTFPIRIICKDNNIEKIIDMIKNHYDLSKISVYKVSDRLIETQN